MNSHWNHVKARRAAVCCSFVAGMFRFGLTGATSLQAATINFINSDGYFNVATNWSPAQKPVPGDQAWVSSQTRTVRVDSAESVDWVYVPAGHVVIEPGGSLTSGGSGMWIRGIFGTASYKMYGGQMTIGGQLRVDAAGPSIQTAGIIQSGSFTLGNLATNIMSGSAALNAGLTGSGAINGSLYISNNATFTYTKNLLDVFSANALIELADQASFSVVSNQIRNNGGFGTLRLVGSSATATANEFGTLGNPWTFEFLFDANLPTLPPIRLAGYNAPNTSVQGLNHDFVVRLPAGFGHYGNDAIPLMRGHDFSGNASFDSVLWSDDISGSVGARLFSAGLSDARAMGGAILDGQSPPRASPSLDVTTSERTGWLTISGTTAGQAFRLMLQSDPDNPAYAADLAAYTNLLAEAGYTLATPDPGYDIGIQLTAKSTGSDYVFFDLETVDAVSGDFALLMPIEQIDLAVSGSAAPNPSPVGDNFTFSITVTNLTGASMTSSFSVTNRLPGPMVYVGSSDGGTYSGGSVRWTIPALGPNASTTLAVTAYHPLQGSFEMVSEVSFSTARSDDPNNANDRSTNTVSFFCPSSGVVTNDAPHVFVATNGQPMAITITATNLDCNAPLLFADGLPAGSSFVVVTNGYGLQGTFTWTPAVGSGTYPVRFYSYNETRATSTVVTLIHVDTAGSPKSGDIWSSQTNWHILITALDASSSANATLVWQSVEGITYDIWETPQAVGSGASWSKSISAVEAAGVLSTADLDAAGTMKFYHVTPQGVARTDRGIWGVVRPAIPSAMHLMSPPLPGDRSFADGGELGSILAAVAPVGARVHFANDAVPNWTTLEKVPGGVWRTDPGNLEYTTPLDPGQAFFIQDAGGSTPLFSGAIGNAGTQTYNLAVGFNILGISEGKGMAPGAALDSQTMSADPVGNYDENLADQVVIQHADGAWRRLVRLPTGVWYDMESRGTTSVRIQPGEAFFYIRRSSPSNLDF